MSLSAVSDITVERVVKQKSPKKHFVFSIQVEWKDGVIIRIYRSYDDVLNLQDKLLQMEQFNSYLSNEAAEYRNRYLLQDKGIFGKLIIKTRKQARRRMVEVEEFLKSIVHLPSLISMADAVVTFFRPVPEDLMFIEPENYKESLKEAKGTRRKSYPLHISEPILLDQYVAISDYTKIDKNDLNLKAGNIVEVIHKADHGWWFVDLDGDLGWVPASYLESRDDEDEQIMETFGDGEEELYIAMGTYEAEYDDEIKLEVGKVVQVKQKKMDGWWLIRCDDGVGWVPCMHLRELSTSSTKAYAREMGREKALMTMNNIFAITDRRRTWNPSLPPKRLSTFKSTVRRRRFEKEVTIHEEDEDEEKNPSYMNIEFHKKNVKKTARTTTTTNNDEAAPSYINLEFHKKDNTKANKKKKVTHKDEEEEKGPSYINMEFHKKNEQAMAPRQRVRRRRDEDEDLVEIDFDKIKERTSQSKEISSETDVVENGSGNNKGEEKSREDGMKVEIKREESLEDLDDGYELPPSIKPQDTEKVLKTEEPGQDPEKGINTNTKSHEKPKPEVVKLKLPEPTDDSTELASGSNIFLAIGDYTKESDREVNLQTGTSVEVLEQSEGGWWLVRTQSLSIGWAPSNFLEKISNEELERRKELGLEPPARPPLRPPKSPRVQRMALHVSTEQKFWNFMRKGDQNDATCSIIDEKDVCCVDNGGKQNLTVMDENGNKLGECDNHMQKPSKDMKKDYICDPQTGVCKLEKDEDYKF